MKTFVFFIISIFVFVSGSAQGISKKPNIVLIVADDLGYGDLGCYGQKLIKTPNLDRIAAMGMRFIQFYAGTSVCAPSRAALLTGLHTGHAPIRGNKEISPEGQWPIADSYFTMAEMMKRAGYTTGDFGKWGLGFIGTEGDPLKQGFDEFYGYNCQRQSHNYYPDHLWHNDKRMDLAANKDSNVYYAPDLIQKHALDFIDKNKQKPFFLYLSYTLPHAALQVPDDSLFAAYKNQFNEKKIEIKKPWNRQGYEPQEYPRAAYATMVTRLDEYIGQVISMIKNAGIDKNTIIIFTSDNGPHVEGGNDPAFFNSNGGFRGVKRDLYEGGIRVPMITYWPGTIKAAQVSDHIGASWDLFSTFSAIAGDKAANTGDGISILPVLLSDKKKAHSFLYWEFHELGGRQAVRMGKWKGIFLNVKSATEKSFELYDLEKDPTEKNNLAEQYPDIVKKIKQVMMEQHKENKDFPFLINAN